MPASPPTPAPAEELGDEGSLLVEDQAFALVGEWVITAEISDAAFRVYSLLLRYGGTSGCRMPSRALLGRRLHRSVDSIDRALRELAAAGIVRIEHRRDGRQFRSNRYHVRTSKPAGPVAEGGGRTVAATPAGPVRGGRRSAATPGRRSAARVAADLRHYPEGLTQTEPPPRATGVEQADRELLSRCGINNLQALSSRCQRARTELGLPAARWSPHCLLAAIQLAVVNRQWPAIDVAAALLLVAADPQTRSPVRVAEAGPWWDQTHRAGDDGGSLDPADLAELEHRLDDLGGRRPAVQAQARTELASEGFPLTRATVTRRACQILTDSRRHDHAPSRRSVLLAGVLPSRPVVDGSTRDGREGGSKICVC